MRTFYDFVMKAVPAAAARVTRDANAEIGRLPPVAAAAAEDAAPAARRGGRSRAGTSEPKLERIVVGEEAEVSAEAPAEEATTSAPARKGWWQRRLGGE